ncbi:hypothetical protein OG851_23050 [Streptomyces sp. NBC_00161]|uniref:hypothetical protein n=1 Tax=Streptomyces sp. NBC_00161 TaxID=2975671 RepID=UPI003249DA7F
MDRITLHGAAALPEVGPLELRAVGHGRPALVMLLIGSPCVGRLVTAPDGLGRLLAVGSCALMAVALVFLLVVHVRLRARGPLVRLDAYGVTVAVGPATPWSDLSGVRRVKGVVVLVPRPGVELPVVPDGVPFSRPARRAAAYTRRYGSPLVLMPQTLDATGPQILAAVQRFGRIPLGAC